MATDKDKYREGFGPFPPGFIRAEYNDPNDVVEKVNKKTAALLVEPIQGRWNKHSFKRIHESSFRH